MTAVCTAMAGRMLIDDRVVGGSDDLHSNLSQEATHSIQLMATKYYEFLKFELRL